MANNPLADKVAQLMQTESLDAILLSARYDVKNFGNAEALFRIGPLLLRFSRDRGQDFLDMAPSSAPRDFYQFDDVQIAMGWKTLDNVISKKEPDPLEELIACVKANLSQLEKAFSGNLDRFTKASIERAARNDWLPPKGGIQ